MNASGVKKTIIVAVILIALLPALPMIVPKPLTFDRITTAIRDAGLPIEGYTEVLPPGLESIAQVSLYVEDVRVDIYQYDDEGKIARNLEYQRPDPGTAVVEAWGLAQSLGAAAPRNLPTLAARRGKFMIVATGEDKALLQRIINIFKAA